MTDEEEQPEGDGENESTPTNQGADFKQIARLLALAAGVAATAIFFVFLFSRLFLPFVVLFERGGGTEYSLTCDEQEDFAQEEPSFEIKKNWIRSANITGYEDIPKNEKDNLSNETREALKNVSSFWYNGTHYQNLSGKRKNLFDTSINAGARLNGNEVDRYVFADSLILYEGDIYYCDIDRVIRGA